MRLPPLIRALRPHQWSKNVFVLAAIGFALGDRTLGIEASVSAVLPVLAAFGAFCLAASTIYLINDIGDVEEDRLHPEKRFRPIAAGEVGIGLARVTAVVTALGSLALALLAGGEDVPVWGVIAIYVAINLAYSNGLKKLALVDAFCIASGFLLRVIAGGAAAGTDISHWLLLCTLFLALFLALNKRRGELTLLGDEGVKHRANLGQYTIPFLDQMVTVLAACTIVCYTMYTVDAETAAKFGEDNHLLWSVPFVLFGIGRYMLLAQTGNDTGNPTKIFLGGDVIFTLNTLAWVAMVGGVLLGWV